MKLSHLKIMSLAFISLGLVACANQRQAQTQEVYHAGFYIPAQYHQGGYQPAYTDSFGNVHPAEDFPAYEQPARWVRSYITEEPTG